MRHLKSGRALGVKPAHRRAMMRNLVTSLVEEERVRTTVARAKELRAPLARMITLGKRGDLSARRQALTFVKSKDAMAKLFGELAERYAERGGGYVRILRTAPRRGDGAEMALVLLVDGPKDPFAEDKKPKRRRGGRRSKKVLDQVAEDVKAEAAEEKPKPRRSTKAKAKETETAEPAEAPKAKRGRKAAAEAEPENEPKAESESAESEE